MGYITIDTGTTNTRIRLIENENIVITFKANVGVRDTAIKGTLKYLKEAIKKGIYYCLDQGNKTIEEIDAIIASGMITSNLGLYEISHLKTPIGIKEISENIVSKMFEDIIDKPIHFIPGVKNRVEDLNIETINEIDIMRGEEVEAIGAISLYPSKTRTIFISPGSHTKFVFMNKNNKIEKCSTTLTGEILWALSKETILAQSINEELIREIDEKYVFKGIESAKKYGFTKSCFLVRLIDTFLDTTPNQRANFLAGSLAYYDIQSIQNDLNRNKHDIIIGGKKILRELYKLVIKKMRCNVNSVTLLNDNDVEKISSVGAVNIYEYKSKYM